MMILVIVIIISLHLGQSYCFFLSTKEQAWVVLIRQMILGNKERVNNASLKSGLFATRHFWTNIMKHYLELIIIFQGNTIII